MEGVVKVGAVETVAKVADVEEVAEATGQGSLFFLARVDIVA